MITIVLALLVLFFAAVEWNLKKPKESYFKFLLKYLLFFNVGVMGLIAAYAHTALADETAKNIGWAPGSPFQFEIGMTNLALGVLGLLCLRWQGLFWVATSISISVFYLGCAVGHYIEYTRGDTAPWNSGFFIWANDIGLPVLLLALTAWYYRNSRTKKEGF